MLVPSLYQFFRRQVQHGFGERGLAEPATVDYVSDILARFAETSALYPIQDADGASLEYIAQFLAEYQRAQGGDQAPENRPRQAAIVRHLGEYTLFMSGLFRERLQARGQLGYYMDHGRSAFWQSADFERNPGRAQLFRRLYFNFERISGALDYVRRVQFPLKTVPSKDAPLLAMWRT